MTYADASALARAYFSDEPGHPLARHRLMDSGEAVVSSEVAAVEFASATWRAHRAGLIPEATKFVQLFDQHRRVDGPLALISLDAARTFPAARELVARYPLTTLDAIHIAVALDLGGTVTFLTADRRQADAAVESGLAVELLVWLAPSIAAAALIASPRWSCRRGRCGGSSAGSAPSLRATSR